jgi:hypothetical protein
MLAAALVVVPLAEAKPNAIPATVSEHGAGQNPTFQAAALSEHGVGQNPTFRAVPQGVALVSEHGAGQNPTFEAVPRGVALVSEHGVGQNRPLTASAALAEQVRLVPSNGFDWGDAGIGAATVLGVALLIGGMTLVVRHGRTRLTSA